MTNHSARDTALPSGSEGRVRRVVGLILVYAGPALVVGTLYASILTMRDPRHASVPLLALGYLLMIGGWLVLPGRLRTRIASAAIAVAALLLGANTVPDSRFVGLDSTLQLAGLAGTVFGAGPVGAIALALATTGMLFAWLRVRGRGGLSYLALIPPFLIQLVFGLLVAAWTMGQFSALRWPVMFATSLNALPLPSVVAAALGAVIGWVLLLGGSAWLAAAIDRAMTAERRARREESRGATMTPAVNGGPVSVVPTNTMAILSLVFAFIVSVLGIVFGHVARGQIRRTGEAGYGLATAGMIIGYVQIGLGALVAVAYAVALATALSNL